MAKFKIKLDCKKIEKEINKQVQDIIKKEKPKLYVQRKREINNLIFLNQNEETMIDVFINKYEETNKYEVQGNVNDFPEYMRFCIKDTMENLKLYGYISNYDLFIDGNWYVIITPDGKEYFEKKGSRIELFDELADDEKELLRDLIQMDNNNEDIVTYIQQQLENDSKDIFRERLGSLKTNGLITTRWADDTVYYVSLTQSGRTYFEREQKNNEKLKQLASNNYNINTLNANNSSLVLGNAINSSFNTNNSVYQIEQEIEEKCSTEEEKKELTELLNEAKEILENMQDSKHIEKRKNFFQKLTNHFDTHGWFYAEIVNLFGQTIIKLLGGI